MSRWLVGGAVAAVLVVVLLLWKQNGDAKRDGRIQELTAQATRDSVVRDSLTRRSDSLARASVAAGAAFAHRDTLWRQVTVRVPQTVTQIVTDTLLPDSAKITRLVALIDTLRRDGDSVAAAGERLAQSVVDLRSAFQVERTAWNAERATQAKMITLLTKQSRHWGVCASGGYGVTRLPSGTLQAGPVLSLGVCYRY